MKLKNKVVIITGACTGIGKAIAETALLEGAKVLIIGLENELGNALVEKYGTHKCQFLHINISQKNAPNLIINEAIIKFKKIDCLINNAAFIASSNIETTTIDFFEKMLSVNTVAPFALIQAALPFLTKTKGNVLNIGSINAWAGEPNLLAYSVSKGGLMTLTRNLGDSLFRDFGIRVNQINPGWVLTEKEILNKQEQGMKDNWYEQISDYFAPSKRIFNPDEIASFATFIISGACGPISSQVFDLEQFPVIGRNLPKDIYINKIK